MPDAQGSSEKFFGSSRLSIWTEQPAVHCTNVHLRQELILMTWSKFGHTTRPLRGSYSNQGVRHRSDQLSQMLDGRTLVASLDFRIVTGNHYLAMKNSYVILRAFLNERKRLEEDVTCRSKGANPLVPRRVAWPGRRYPH